MTWQVQEAKQRLSEVLRAAEDGDPQVITRHGRDVAVIVDIATYRRLAGIEVSLADFLRHGAVLDGPAFDDLDLDRSAELSRVVDLGDDGVPPAQRSTPRS